MSSQGDNYESLKTVVCHLRLRNERLCKKVLKCKENFGELSDKSGESILHNIDDILDQPIPSPFDTPNQETMNLNDV